MSEHPQYSFEDFGCNGFALITLEDKSFAKEILSICAFLEKYGNWENLFNTEAKKTPRQTDYAEGRFQCELFKGNVTADIVTQLAAAQLENSLKAFSEELQKYQLQLPSSPTDCVFTILRTDKSCKEDQLFHRDVDYNGKYDAHHFIGNNTLKLVHNPTYYHHFVGIFGLMDETVIRVVPGSHQVDDSKIQLSYRSINFKPGQLLIMHPRLIHSGWKYPSTLTSECHLRLFIANMKKFYNGKTYLTAQNFTCDVLGSHEIATEKKISKEFIQLTYESLNAIFRYFVEKCELSKKSYFLDAGSGTLQLSIMVHEEYDIPVKKIEVDKRRYHRCVAELYNTMNCRSKTTSLITVDNFDVSEFDSLVWCAILNSVINYLIDN